MSNQHNKKLQRLHKRNYSDEFSTYFSFEDVLSSEHNSFDSYWDCSVSTSDSSSMSSSVDTNWLPSCFVPGGITDLDLQSEPGTVDSRSTEPSKNIESDSDYVEIRDEIENLAVGDWGDRDQEPGNFVVYIGTDEIPSDISSPDSWFSSASSFSSVSTCTPKEDSSVKLKRRSKNSLKCYKGLINNSKLETLDEDKQVEFSPWVYCDDIKDEPRVLTNSFSNAKRQCLYSAIRKDLKKHSYESVTENGPYEKKPPSCISRLLQTKGPRSQPAEEMERGSPVTNLPKMNRCTTVSTEVEEDNFDDLELEAVREIKDSEWAKLMVPSALYSSVYGKKDRRQGGRSDERIAYSDSTDYIISEPIHTSSRFKVRTPLFSSRRKYSAIQE